MVRPAAFQFNEETAANNFFQKNEAFSGIQDMVLKEFDAFVATLSAHNVEVNVMEDTPVPVKPDAIFPNNWIGLLPGGKITIFPMLAGNRRLEKRQDIIQWVKDTFVVNDIKDLSDYEPGGLFLEGTGSLIFDHENKMVYAAVSPRTSPELAIKYAGQLGYELILFHAADASGQQIYHTNVLMAMGHEYCIICLKALTDRAEREMVKDKLRSSGKEIIDISFSQMEHFCGNALQVINRDGQYLLVCSQSAFENFTTEQLENIRKFNPVISVEIPTIEKIGGGSARCMMAENYLERKG